MKPLIIIDGHNLLFKAYSVPFRFSSSKGTPLFCVTTYLSLIRRSIAAVSNSSSLVVVFDCQGRTNNHKLDEEYKANRPTEVDEDDNPFIHLPYIKKVLDFCYITWTESPGTEADDIIASIAVHNSKSNGVSYITSSDSDFYQLFSNRIKMIKLSGFKEYKILDKDWLESEYKVSPQEYIELKCWVGDSTDNIKGIKGIGWKRGLEIIKGQRKRALTKEEEGRLALNRKLITLDTNIKLEELNLEYDSSKLALSNKQIFADLDF